MEFVTNGNIFFVPERLIDVTALRKSHGVKIA